jgi:hypothetical protein
LDGQLHWLLMQADCGVVQAWVHVPQCCALLLVSTHALSHFVALPEQTSVHAPPTQLSLVAQT